MDGHVVHQIERDPLGMARPERGEKPHRVNSNRGIVPVMASQRLQFVRNRLLLRLAQLWTCLPDHAALKAVDVQAHVPLADVGPTSVREPAEVRAPLPGRHLEIGRVVGKVVRGLGEVDDESRVDEGEFFLLVSSVSNPITLRGPGGYGGANVNEWIRDAESVNVQDSARAKPGVPGS